MLSYLVIAGALLVGWKLVVEYRAARIAVLLSSAALSIMAFVQLVLPSLYSGVPSPEGSIAARIVAKYSLVHAGDVVPFPACSPHEEGFLNFRELGNPMLSMGGDWGTKAAAGGWTVTFTEQPRNPSPLMSPLAGMTSNPDPRIGVEVGCRPPAIQGSAATTAGKG